MSPRVHDGLSNKYYSVDWYGCASIGRPSLSSTSRTVVKFTHLRVICESFAKLRMRRASVFGYCMSQRSTFVLSFPKKQHPLIIMRDSSCNTVAFPTLGSVRDRAARLVAGTPRMPIFHRSPFIKRETPFTRHTRKGLHPNLVPWPIQSCGGSFCTILELVIQHIIIYTDLQHDIPI